MGDVVRSVAGDEVVVGTLDGTLLGYERLQTGMLGNLLYSTRLEGARAAYNGIVIADLDQDQQNELYVADSFGLRKLLDTPPAN